MLHTILLTYKISIWYRYRDILTISYRYRIELQNQYRCITNTQAFRRQLICCWAVNQSN